MNATQEEWRPVVGWEGYYEVSDQGRVRSLNRTIVTSKGPRSYAGRIIRARLSKGYPVVTMTRPGQRKSAKIHTLVLEAFVGSRPTGKSACHNNGIPTDNRVENLRWDTHTENMRDIVRHGNHFYAKRTHCSKGHEYGSEVRAGRSGRRCVQCEKEYNATYHQASHDARRASGWVPRYEKATCPRGHEYDYFYTDKNGRTSRHCKTCRAQNNSRARLRRKASMPCELEAST